MGEGSEPIQQHGTAEEGGLGEEEAAGDREDV